MGQLEDIRGVIEREVFKAYDAAVDTLVDTEIAPTLEDIYDEFYMTVISNIEEAVEEVFGEGSKITEQTLFDMGIDSKGIPTILTVRIILDSFGLGYIYKEKLYNHIQLTLFREETMDEPYLNMDDVF